MKTNKQKKNIKNQKTEDFDVIKPKKKIISLDPKINLKSKKNWKELYEDEDDDLEKF